jgi:hypothetical protein
MQAMTHEEVSTVVGSKISDAIENREWSKTPSENLGNAIVGKQKTPEMLKDANWRVRHVCHPEESSVAHASCVGAKTRNVDSNN